MVGRNKHLDSLKTTLVVFVIVNLLFKKTFWTRVFVMFKYGFLWIGFSLRVKRNIFNYVGFVLSDASLSVLYAQFK